MLLNKWMFFTIILSTRDAVHNGNNALGANEKLSYLMRFSNPLGDDQPDVIQNGNIKIGFNYFLSSKNTRLFENYVEGKRERRSNDMSCGLYGNLTELRLSMDFSNGNVKVDYLCLPNITNGKIVLFDKNDKEIERNDGNLTKSTGTMSFYSSMNENYSAKYLVDDNTVLNTGKWNNCGYNWTNLNKLPSNYGTINMRVQINDGAPYVCLRHSGSSVNYADDWVMIQPLVNLTSNQRESNWKLVSTFSSVGTNTICKVFTRFDTSFEDGFRVKYIYNNGTDQYESQDDNSSPYWNQTKCSVSDAIRFEGNNKSTRPTTTGPKRTDETSRGMCDKSKILLPLFLVIYSIILKD